MSGDLAPNERAAEAAAEALHQHGPLRSDADAGRHGQTLRWQDCSHAETHRGAGRDVARAVLDAVGYDALTAERDRLRDDWQRVDQECDVLSDANDLLRAELARRGVDVAELLRSARATLDGDS